ncbi:hypothetical protein HPB48_022643 [Haemaphysalis longicornis]|uniref:Uncharacterized protein n=1 Tax=Haemaphysalis longicornis TaxID=44386 RepID=A0A9J6GHW8_HAELO|nr:hypothetical protein HPB48_022643 [Haemaphysalis longicornis]
MQALKDFFAERLTDVRHNLALSRAVSQDSLRLADLHTGLHNLILHHVMSLLMGLLAFAQPQLLFAKRGKFQDMICI